jgi:hypothetical protein
MHFGQQSETVTTSSTVETLSLDDIHLPQLKVNLPVEEATLIPMLEKNVIDGEEPTIQLNLPEEVKTREMALEVYPNPSKGLFTIRIPETNQQILAIEVFDLTGKNRYTDRQFNLDKPLEKDIDITALETGVYILRVVFEENVLVQRIVKRN